MTPISDLWDSSVFPTLVDCIRIPAKSPHFDKDWAKNGHIDAVSELAAKQPEMSGWAEGPSP